jgi:hypothetical protein
MAHLNHESQSNTKPKIKRDQQVGTAFRFTINMASVEGTKFQKCLIWLLVVSSLLALIAGMAGPGMDWTK